MKNLILLVLFWVLFNHLSAQDSTTNKTVDNNNKIEELNDRVNSLLDTIYKEPVDDFTYGELALLRSEIVILKDSIAKLNLKLNAHAENGAQQDFKIIVSSVRTKEGVDVEKERLSKQFSALEVYQNRNKSWYHLAVANQYEVQAASQEVYRLRKEGISSAWLIRKSNLIQSE